MGALDCGAMVVRGFFDVFDRAIGAIEHIEELLEREDIPAQLHPARSDGFAHTPAHFHDPKADMQADLGRAKEMIFEACQIAQNVMAEM